MAYDFDTVIDRHHTGCLKYDAAKARGHREDDLSLWVADMDFRMPPEILDALRARIDEGIFGYSMAKPSYYEAVQSWFEGHHGFRPERRWFVTTPGVVFALSAAVRAFTSEGDGVLIQPPVYYPFKNTIEDNGRVVVEAPLACSFDDAGELRYRIDFDAFEKTMREKAPKLFILCNPANPVGRAWTEEELSRIAEICLRNDVIIVSDEIHADFAQAGHAHTSLALLGDDVLAHSVICTSPSKTFNIAGLQISNIFIANPQLKAAFKRAIAQMGYDEPSAIGLAAAEACYALGAPWLAELKRYLAGNYETMRSIFAAEAPALKVAPLESTYLPWVDCRALGLGNDGLVDLVENKARLWLDMGTMFGTGGEGFIRFNIACPRSIVEEACHRLACAVHAL